MTQSTPPSSSPARNVLPELVSQPGYWRSSYKAGDTGWDKGAPAPPIARLLGSGLIPAGSRIIVPGCGYGHEVEAAARLGYETFGVDFADEAVAAARKRLDIPGVRAQFVRADIFALVRTHAGAFDTWLEHTCFCAIDPARRGEYIDVVQGVLRPRGLFAGLFYLHGEPGGPPYDATEAEIRGLTDARFEALLFETPPDSFPNRQGKERLFLYRKR